jgi:hypothetical protein
MVGGWGEALAGKNSTVTFLSMKHKPEGVIQFSVNMFMGQDITLLPFF